MASRAKKDGRFGLPIMVTLCFTIILYFSLNVELPPLWIIESHEMKKWKIR